MAKDKAAKKPTKKQEAAPKKAAKKQQPTKSKQAPKKQEEPLTEELIDQILEEMSSFKEELAKSRKNASAARRARKHSTNLEKMFKTFRKASNDQHRKE